MRKGSFHVEVFMTDETFSALEEKIAYHFGDKNLLRQALTHSSYANEMKINKYEDYERLEFLGDAVLELVSSDFLFREREETPEGELTKMRASMVCEPALALCKGFFSGTVYTARKGRGGNRGKKPGLHRFRCDGGSDWRNLSGRGIGEGFGFHPSLYPLRLGA